MRIYLVLVSFRCKLEFIRFLVNFPREREFIRPLVKFQKATVNFFSFVSPDLFCFLCQISLKTRIFSFLINFHCKRELIMFLINFHRQHVVRYLSNFSAKVNLGCCIFFHCEPFVQFPQQMRIWRFLSIFTVMVNFHCKCDFFLFLINFHENRQFISRFSL
jgi:hypothetical protein